MRGDGDVEGMYVGVENECGCVLRWLHWCG